MLKLNMVLFIDSCYDAISFNFCVHVQSFKQNGYRKKNQNEPHPSISKILYISMKVVARSGAAIFFIHPSMGCFLLKFQGKGQPKADD
jgi:hypothetical protein